MRSLNPHEINYQYARKTQSEGMEQPSSKHLKMRQKMAASI